MQVQAIRENSIALYTNIDELNSRGICESSLNSRTCADMIRESFESLGIRADGALEVETYINGKAVLIFARVCKCTDTVTALFVFDNTEHLISACHSITSYPLSTLFWKDGMYYLAIHSCVSASTIHILSEYGDIVQNPALTYHNLCEHGKLLHSGNALKMLRDTFPLKACEKALFADSVNPIK